MLILFDMSFFGREWYFLHYGRVIKVAVYRAPTYIKSKGGKPMNRQCEEEKKHDKIKWLVLILFLIVLVLGIIIGIMFFRKISRERSTAETIVPNDKISGGVELVINPDAESDPSYPKDDSIEQGVTISGWKAMTIPANKKQAAVGFYNPKENAELYYLTFELRLYSDGDQDYEVLYTSGLVEPGKRIDRITLSRELEKGVYEAVVHVQPYRMNDEKTLTNNADMKIKLIVK